VTSKGLDVVASSSKELAATIREETITVGEMVRAAGVQPE
jgi:tripartite-type tricarboxylate transporter receptor subunit TctC